ncbi:hypothetical protein SERLA73DRAFT_142462 [Serpula lacrymans var. lacrymans S7.3]|uniref:Uncharacterized protein n=2 Tax=Serpula lacrymans var. lacrymans TaxID=341189 RepID=F8Q7U6_SERL3|nr:uncharacterized protein SERLADRAFT_398553 [Serpula lacrymans var. lacrymans S7.9]EGN95634.1 hypothetical protein SERLA73DRAFT_142462 [Serpula lacrymans var. lacrymans S7.3]EGO21161.1 hypothetical protein SERLADRAFT_398553 [Serpula lacrymans var. lacrymans S7.9]
MDFNSTEDEQRSGEREAKTTTMSIKPTYVDVSETLHAGQHHGAQAQFSQYCPALSSSTSASTTGGTWQFTEPETPVTSSGGRLMPSTSDVQATPRALDEGFLTSYVSMFDQYIQCPILDSNINPALWCSVRNDDYDFVSEAMSSTSSSESLLNAFDDLPETLWPTSMRSQSLNSSSCSSGSSASAVMSPSPTLTNQSTSLDRRLTPLGSPSSESIGQLELFSDNGVDEARFLSDEGNLMREYYARLQHNEDMGLQSLNAIKLE